MYIRPIHHKIDYHPQHKDALGSLANIYVCMCIGRSVEGIHPILTSLIATSISSKPSTISLITILW